MHSTFSKSSGDTGVDKNNSFVLKSIPRTTPNVKQNQ